jgi:cellulose synthase/poly-beta-1,6-N-acetylglucosamine synthase-like glycosyltransferase
VTAAFQIFGYLVLGYFAALSCIYVVMTGVAWSGITRYLRASSYAGADETFASPLTPGISVLLPAYNEEAGIVESVRSLLSLRYPKYEIVVVNDGSKDATMERLTEEFELAPVRLATRDSVECAPVRGTYVSREYPQLVVIDKENGGKADALNCGLNTARHPFFCAVDADALIEPDALLQVAKPIIDDPELVIATGGIVRIANGCTVEHGRVTHVGLPTSRLAALQVVEYLRAFLIGRMGWSRFNSLLIISGAFGLFSRAVVEEVGGYATDTVGEDIELVVRMHRHMRDQGRPYRMEFLPDPVCWTEAPTDFATLSKQRRRWQRGLLETFWRHRTMIGNPRYGFLGMCGMPHMLFFEGLSPVVEVAGYLLIPAAFLAGALSVKFLVAFLVLAVLFGILLSVSALALEEFSFRRHERSREVGRMFLLAVMENFGYRQLVSLWRVRTFFDLFRAASWGEMRRTGFGETAESPAGSGLSRRSVAAPTGRP